MYIGYWLAIALQMEIEDKFLFPKKEEILRSHGNSQLVTDK